MIADFLKTEFTLMPDDTVSVLGTQVRKLDSGEIDLTQPHLAKCCLKVVCRDDCNDVKSSATVNALGTEAMGDECTESWQLSSIIGLLMYLASNTHPKITFSVPQCTWFTHCA